MSLLQLFKQIRPFATPYRWLVFGTLFLTLIGSFAA